MRHVAPAEDEPFQSPVPTRMVSNGEYMPHPQTEQQKHVEYRIKELAFEAAKRLGQSRRQFLLGTGGLAAAFIAMNEVHGKTFNVERGRDVRARGLRREGGAEGPFSSSTTRQRHIVRSSMNSPQGLRAPACTRDRVRCPRARATPATPFNGTGGNAAGPDEFGNLWPD